MRKKLFFLVSRFPYPIEKGDKLRAFNQLKILSKAYDITLCCLTVEPIRSEDIEAVSPYCVSVKIVPLKKWLIALNAIKAIFSALPFQVHYFYQRQAKSKIAAYLDECQPNLVYCQLIRTSEYVIDYFDAPKILDFMDCFSKGFERNYKTEKSILKHVYRLESERLRQYEASIFPYFEYKTVISNQDRQFFIHPKKMEIEVIPNGVDTAIFKAAAVEPLYEIGFIGNMGYPPNRDAAFFLVNEILPRLQQQIPEAKLLIAGASIPKKLLEHNHPAITYINWPKNIATCYAQCKILVAPIRLGSGMQNKVLEAMALKTPCICSKQVANAFQNLPEKSLVIAEETQEFVNGIIQLLNTPLQAKQQADIAYSYVKENFTWEKTVDKLTSILNSVVKS
ncbi:MAG: glycosyltransferase [Luteibaculaceae bacterium]